MKVGQRNIFRGGASFILRHPVGVIVAGVLAAVLSLFLTATQLTFHTDRLDLISAGNRYRLLDAAYEREFQSLPDGVIVVIRSPNPATARAFATALAERWQGDPRFDQVVYRFNTEALKRKALMYLSADELRTLDETLQEQHNFLRDFAAELSLQNLFGLVNREMTQAMVDQAFTGFLQEGTQKDVPPDLSPLRLLLQRMQRWMAGDQSNHANWTALLTKDSAPAPQDGYLWSDNGQFLFVLVQPKGEAGEFSQFTQAVEQVRADVRALQQTYPTIEVGVTGKDVLEADEMSMAQRDTAVATVISVVGVALLYFALFRGIVKPLFALITLLMALCWVLGVTTLTIGHLNILTMVFLPMFMGLGIDYGSYVIARYNEERGLGEEVGEALRHTFIATGPGIVTTALTTAFTFMVLMLTGFKGIAELGFIGGSGILLAALATFTILPALLTLQARRAQGDRRVPVVQKRASTHGYLWPLYRRPWATLLLSALLAGISLSALNKVDVDFNLLHLQAKGTESVIWVQNLFQSAKRSLLFGELTAGSLAEVRRKTVALKNLPSVAEVESILTVIPDNQEHKRPLIEGLRPALDDIPAPSHQVEGVDVPALASILERIRFKLLEAGEATAQDSETAQLYREMAETGQLIDHILTMMGQMSQAEAARVLSAFQAEIGGNFEELLDLLRANVRAEPVTVADLPSELRARYIGRTGTYRLFVYPKEDVWSYEPLSRFVHDLRSVEPDVLGAPITNFEFMREIAEAYGRASLYAFFGIAFLAYLMFRRLWPTLLALVPLTLGSLWMLGFMGLFQVPFNVANLLVLPLIMAPAVESGIMIVSRYQEENRGSQAAMALPKSTGQAVVFSSLSTIVGFGSLMISHHQGIYSIGVLLTCGVGSVLVASLTTLPSLLTLLASKIWLRPEHVQPGRDEHEVVDLPAPTGIAVSPRRSPAGASSHAFQQRS